MLLLNITLLLHFAAFVLYVIKLTMMILQPDKPKDKQGLVLGIIILLTGIALVALKYPAINYYKVIPKTGLFLAVTVINIIYERKPAPRSVNYILLGLAIAASLIAVVKV